MVGLPWLQLAGGKLGVIRRIGKVLRLQAEPGALVIDVTVLAMERSIQKIAGIELYPGLGRFHG